MQERRRIRLTVGLLATALFVLAFGATAMAATFSAASPAAAATVSSPVTLTVMAQASYGPHTPAGWYNSLDPHLMQQATLVVDGGAPVAVTGTYEWGWVYDDPDAIINDAGYMGLVYGSATYSKSVSLAGGSHTAVLTVTETDPNPPYASVGTYTYTWNFQVQGGGGGGGSIDCSQCHAGYPTAHTSATMSNCSLCHKPSNSPVYDHGGGYGTPTLAGCSRNPSTCHGGAANHNGSYMGEHTRYDLEGNPVVVPAMACEDCHTVSQTHLNLVGSTFTYQDLQDMSPKTQGGYDCSTCHGVAGGPGGISPHGGYSATTNKCKVCHAVHRAAGAYYLLRADSQSDACDYCHVGGSAHSEKVVYDLNPAGTATTNGHTIGAGMVPDSTVKQTAAPVTITGTDMDGATVTETIQVRSYDAQRIALYRFSRHHSQNPAGTGRSGFKPIGPNALSCFSCHQPHNAPAQVWQPSKFTTSFADPTAAGVNTSGYKLLRRYPAGAWLGLDGAIDGTRNSYGFVDLDKAIKVPETTLTAGVNFSTTQTASFTYTENGIPSKAPVWIAQNISGEAGGTGPAEDPATVNQYTLSVWCADCHNLNIGGSETLTNEELGFKAHTERTHPAPFTGAHNGPGQCYSCHRNDLSVSEGVADPAGYGFSQPAAQNSTTDACSQCHYGTLAYMQDRHAASGRQSDFPHSGKTTDMKLLGSYTANVAGSGSYVPVFTTASIGENNLDAVCIRCHPGIGVHN